MKMIVDESFPSNQFAMCLVINLEEQIEANLRVELLFILLINCQATP